MLYAIPLLAAATLLWAPGEVAEDPSAADQARMQGDWRVVSLKDNGLNHPQEEVEALFRTVEGDKFSVARYMRQVSSGTFTLDATQTPKTITSIITSTPKPIQIQGIYEFDGDKLRICNAQAGKPRPQDFGCRLGSMQTLIEWEPDK